jgi:hypothetical protein
MNKPAYFQDLKTVAGNIVALTEEQKERVMKGLQDFRAAHFGVSCRWEKGSIFEMDGLRMTVVELYEKTIPTHVLVG